MDYGDDRYILADFYSDGKIDMFGTVFVYEDNYATATFPVPVITPSIVSVFGGKSPTSDALSVAHPVWYSLTGTGFSLYCERNFSDAPAGIAWNVSGWWKNPMDSQSYIPSWITG